MDGSNLDYDKKTGLTVNINGVNPVFVKSSYSVRCKKSNLEFFFDEMRILILRNLIYAVFRRVTRLFRCNASKLFRNTHRANTIHAVINIKDLVAVETGRVVWGG